MRESGGAIANRRNAAAAVPADQCSGSARVALPAMACESPEINPFMHAVQKNQGSSYYKRHKEAVDLLDVALIARVGVHEPKASGS